MKFPSLFHDQNGVPIDRSSKSAASIDIGGLVESKTGSIKVSNGNQMDDSDEVEEIEQNNLGHQEDDLEESIDLKMMNFSLSDLPKTKEKQRVEKFLKKHENIRKESLIETGHATYPTDCYSFISTHGPRSLFWWFGIMIFAFQISFLVLIMAGTLSPKWKSGKVDDNPTDGPFADFINTEASPVVRSTRIIALLTSIIFIDASVMDIIVAVHTFPTYSMATKRDNYWCMAFSCILRGAQGFMTQLAMLILIFTTNDVIDIILNFTALNFVSTLDDMAFALAKSGKYGTKFENECKRVEELPLPVCMYRDHKHQRFLVTIIPLGVVVFGIFGFFVSKMVSPTHWETLILRIQFKQDEGFQAYNGCYYKDFDRKNLLRNFYNGSDLNQKTAQFGFCSEDRRWYMYEGNSTEEDPCNANEIIHSTPTDYFEISTMFLEDWFTATGTPVELYFFEDEPEGEFLHCDAFVKDGICNPQFNEENLQWDGGDCCANTCDHPACWTGGLFDAFGSVDTSGDGFPGCKDPSMVPLTVHLNSFTNNRDLYKENSKHELSDMNRTYIQKFIQDFWEIEPEDALLSIICDEDEVLRYYINPTMENESEVVMVNDGAQCTIRIENTTSSNPSFLDDPVWYVNYTVYDGVPESIEDNPTQILQEFTRDNGVVSFEKIPECYFDILSEHIDYETIYEHNTPSSKAIYLIVDENSRSTSCSPYLVERYALYATNFAAPIRFFNSMGENQTRLWIEEGRTCTWQNILCSGQAHESSNLDLLDLDLSGLLLVGYIATEIGMLDNLALYDVSKNSLTGSIPSEIGLLTELSLLRLKDNRLTGSIPSEIGLLTLMKELFMERNRFSSTIPTEIGLLTDLVDLTIHENELTGTIPSEIGLLTSLTQLRLGSNRLTGPIPTEIVLLSNLNILNMNDNDLIGSISSEISLLTQLERLSIDKNALTGSIPSEIGLMTALTRLDIDDTSLTGIIPIEMENLEDLEKIYMDGISIPKHSVPTSLTGKIAEPCIPCAGLGFDTVNATIVGNGDNDKCSIILAELTYKPLGGRIAIDDCDLLQDQCIVCNDS